MINYKMMKIEDILILDKEDRERIPLSHKVIKLSEEIGELVESIQYFEDREQLEEMYDVFNVCLVILHNLKKDKLNKEFLESILSVSAQKPSFKNITIYIGKINSALLLKEQSIIISKSAKEESLEEYVIELMKEIVGFIKYKIDENVESSFIFEEVVENKLIQWKNKQNLN